MKQKSREALARAAGILTGIIFSIVKKHQEDTRKAMEEAVNRAEKEQWMDKRIQCIERECNERVDCLQRRIEELDERLEALDHRKERKLNETEGLIEWKACPICSRMRQGEDDPR